MVEFGRAVQARIVLGVRKVWRKNELSHRWHKMRLLLVVALSVGVVHAAAAPDPLISTLAGGGSALGDGGPATAALLNKPLSIAVDAAGNIYVADNMALRVRKITPAGVINTVAGNGTAAYNGEQIPAISAGIVPKAVAVDAAGNLYIAESSRVRKVSTNGLISTVAGNGVAGYGGDGGVATAAQLYGVNDIALDRQGNLYIADGINNRIRRVASTGIIDTVAGNGSTVVSSCGCSGDGSPAKLAAVWSPQGIALDAGDNLYVVETIGRLRRIDSAGIIDTVGGNGIFGADPAPRNVALALRDLAFDSRGNAYFSNAGLVLMLTVHGSLHVVAGTIDESTGGFYGESGFSGDGGPAKQALLRQPEGVALDAQNNLLIADSANGRIRKVSAVPQPVEPPGMFAFRAATKLDRLSMYLHKEVASGDVNGDGRDDIVFSTSTDPHSTAPYQTEFYGVGIVLQAPGGVFMEPFYLRREWPATTTKPILERGGLALADFNGDGVKDIVVSHGAGIEFIAGSRVNVFGARSFSGAYTAPAQELLVMDVNGDGNADLVARTTASATDFTQGIGIYFGSGTGEVLSRNFMAVPFPIAGLAGGDLNGDGLKDIATGFTESPGEPDAGGVAVFLKNAANGFAPARKYNALDHASDGVTIGDFNGDGRSDVVVGPHQFINITNLSVFSQDTAGQLLAPVALRTGVTPDAMLATDLNADGRDDLLVAHTSIWALGYHQQSSAGLAAEVKYEIPPLDYLQASSIAVGDVNHDGYKDALVVKAQGTLAVLYGTGRREGIRVNGGQPLVRADSGAAATQPTHQKPPVALVDRAELRRLVKPASVPARLYRAAVQWSEPMRRNTTTMGIRFLGAALMESFPKALRRLHAISTGRRADTPSVDYSPAPQHRLPVESPKRSVSSISASVGHNGSAYRSVCIRAP